MEHSKLSFIRTNKRILQKEKIYNKRKKKNKYLKIFLCFGLTILFCVNILFFIFIILFQKKSSNNKGIKYIINKNNIKNNQIENGKKNENSIDNNNNIENEQDINPNCTKLDPILVFNQRLNNGPITICDNGDSNHICYQNLDGYYNDIFLNKNGVICKMKNIILDPEKSEQSKYIYNGPVDIYTLGGPILNRGFFNMKCDNPKMLSNYYIMYNRYFSGWNYNYENNKDEKIEELAPGKTIFFISRNQDSPNLYHGMTDIIATISMMQLFNITEDNAQIVFLESMYLKGEPFYEIYKKVLSRGGEPIFIKDLKEKYHISSAIHIPINWDSPCFFKSDYSGYEIPKPDCKTPSKTYKLYNYLVDKYLNIPNFTDSFISDKETFYYPKSVIKYHKSKKNFTKKLTIQWRRVWPKGRTGQGRLIGNGKELADKLSSILPKNILIRLVNTASLPMKEQISIMRNTDYLVGIHGAGLSLSIFMPYKSILHEILHSENINVLRMMSSISGHKTYSDILNAEVQNIDENEYIFFNVDDFGNSVLNHMKENHFIY